MGGVKKRWIISMSGWIPTLASRECQGFRGLCKDGRRVGGRSKNVYSLELPTAPNKRYIEFAFSA